MALKWQEHAHPTRGTVYIAETPIAYRDVYGIPREHEFTLRIDGRREAFRVDLNDCGIWTAIDDGGFASLDTAKEYAAHWVNLANAQRTLSPTGVPLVPLTRAESAR